MTSVRRISESPEVIESRPNRSKRLIDFNDNNELAHANAKATTLRIVSMSWFLMIKERVKVPCIQGLDTADTK